MTNSQIDEVSHILAFPGTNFNETTDCHASNITQGCTHTVKTHLLPFDATYIQLSLTSYAVTSPGFHPEGQSFHRSPLPASVPFVHPSTPYYVILLYAYCQRMDTSVIQ